ncbi:23S rRNA (adenine(2030)-N(6))-methyltransferase RlmJ [Pacificoceanicola onchidii]|uniref:23S rRNA (adenine(2030)-N(6))-methyltransferase RlmJ n=1 Tax=Pacificoceanicola onchidii TaxID=2562685 RepID=UPI0010A69BC1|nr:23S rRNA (adenine(2030)-N(6))-methyltransferase RlmJ [Pacificoceanicola onchidii]
MLSYQHAYHAGNLADVHKHALLARALSYLTKKDKPLSYIETHSGRGLYDLSGAEAQKTGEAAQGISLAEQWFDQDHPYRQALQTIRDKHGPDAYPGSPVIAQTLLRQTDQIHLAELHPQEHAALSYAMSASHAKVYSQDGFALAQSLCPPTPRRGLILIDPSWEIKDDYARMPKFVASLTKKWNVGIVMIWYPILTDPQHMPMIRAIKQGHPEALIHEVPFPPARKGHRMIGSGMAILNTPWGLADEAKALTKRFKSL